MTNDYAAVLAALPKKRRGDTDALPAFYESRLAECERLLEYMVVLADGDWADFHLADARAYLQFRAAETKEQGT